MRTGNVIVFSQVSPGQANLIFCIEASCLDEKGWRQTYRPTGLSNQVILVIPRYLVCALAHLGAKSPHGTAVERMVSLDPFFQVFLHKGICLHDLMGDKELRHRTAESPLCSNTYA